tara:strand:+ start:1841 stop:2065 length:225 start_codon:yes stop_codon:yes gene_type:complete
MKEIVDKNTWIININDDYTVINYGYVEKDGVLLAGQPILEKYYTEKEWRLSLENYDIFPEPTPPLPEPIPPLPE